MEYQTKALGEEILHYYSKGKKLEKFDFAPVEPGKSRKIEVEVKNMLGYSMSLKPWVSDEDVHILEYPSMLRAYDAGMVLIEFAPKPNRLKPLDTEWGFEVHIGG